MHDSAHARLGTMAVIEQAKGIIMAQHGCAPEEAFALLREVSQRANVKLHVLAAQIVAQVTPPPEQDRSNVTPISPGHETGATMNAGVEPLGDAAGYW